MPLPGLAKMLEAPETAMTWVAPAQAEPPPQFRQGGALVSPSKLPAVLPNARIPLSVMGSAVPQALSEPNARATKIAAAGFDNSNLDPARITPPFAIRENRQLQN
jgi:hypothetical protein